MRAFFSTERQFNAYYPLENNSNIQHKSKKLVRNTFKIGRPQEELTKIFALFAKQQFAATNGIGIASQIPLESPGNEEATKKEVET